MKTPELCFASKFAFSFELRPRSLLRSSGEVPFWLSLILALIFHKLLSALSIAEMFSRRLHNCSLFMFVMRVFTSFETLFSLALSSDLIK